MSDNTYLKDVCTHKEAVNAACDILERSNRTLTTEEAQTYLDNARLIYDCLYSSFVQRKKALRDMKIYTEVIAMLNRRS